MSFDEDIGKNRSICAFCGAQPEWSRDMMSSDDERVSICRHCVGARHEVLVDQGKATPHDPELLCCTFCELTQQQVRKLIAGPGVYICDQCVERLVFILESEQELDPEAEDPEPEATV